MSWKILSNSSNTPIGWGTEWVTVEQTSPGMPLAIRKYSRREIVTTAAGTFDCIVVERNDGLTQFISNKGLIKQIYYELITNDRAEVIDSAMVLTELQTVNF